MQILTLYKVNIRDATGKPVQLDYILRKIPNITEITYWSDCEIHSNESLKKLNSIGLENKLRVLSLYIIQTSEEIDAEILGTFVESNLASGGQLNLRLPRNTPEIGNLLSKIRQVIKNWQTPGGSPCYHVGTI